MGSQTSPFVFKQRVRRAVCADSGCCSEEPLRAAPPVDAAYWHTQLRAGGSGKTFSSVGGGTATTNVNLRWKLDEVNMCEEAVGILELEDASSPTKWPACCCQRASPGFFRTSVRPADTLVLARMPCVKGDGFLVCRLNEFRTFKRLNNFFLLRSGGWYFAWMLGEIPADAHSLLRVLFVLPQRLCRHCIHIQPYCDFHPSVLNTGMLSLCCSELFNYILITPVHYAT